eukprot:scpid40509/ scgid30712/ 
MGAAVEVAPHQSAWLDVFYHYIRFHLLVRTASTNRRTLSSHTGSFQFPPTLKCEPTINACAEEKSVKLLSVMPEPIMTGRVGHAACTDLRSPALAAWPVAEPVKMTPSL